MTKTSKTTKEAAQSVADTMETLQKMGLSSMTWMGTDWMERMSDLGSEMLQFLAERVQKDVDLQHKLLHCRDMHELHKIQAEFMQTAIDRYTEETGKLIEMGTKAMTPNFKPAESDKEG